MNKYDIKLPDGTFYTFFHNPLKSLIKEFFTVIQKYWSAILHEFLKCAVYHLFFSILPGPDCAVQPNMRPFAETLGASAYFSLCYKSSNGLVFYPKSSFAEGRNALLRMALGFETGLGFRYFTFLDDDVKLEFNVNRTRVVQGSPRR